MPTKPRKLAEIFTYHSNIQIPMIREKCVLHMLGLFPKLGVDIARQIVSYMNPRQHGRFLQTCKFKGSNAFFTQKLKKCEEEALHAPVVMVTDPLSDTVAPMSHHFLYPNLDMFSALVDKVLHAVVPSEQKKIAEDARRFFYNFCFYLIDKIFWSALRFTLFKPRHHNLLIIRNCTSREVQGGVRSVMFDGELCKHSVSEGVKAVTKLTSHPSWNVRPPYTQMYLAFSDP